MFDGKKEQFLADWILAWTPFFIIFIVFPIAIYVPNQVEFEYKLSPVGTLVAVGFAALIPLLALYWLKPALRTWVAHGPFFLGLFILLADTIGPLQWGEFNGGEKLTEPLRHSFIELGLAALLVILWLKLSPRVVRALGVSLVVTVLALQLLTLTRAVPQAVAFARNPDPGASRVSQNVPAKLPNIYHFCFDGYSSLLFQRHAEMHGLKDEFNGFVFFPLNLANYIQTRDSLPSFLTGRLSPGLSIMNFLINVKRTGLRRTLQDAGYQIVLYLPNNAGFWSYYNPSYLRTADQLAEEQSDQTSAGRLATIAFVRAAPTLLKQETLLASNTVFQGASLAHPLLPLMRAWSVPLVEAFLADEADRPASGQYVYVHPIIPHMPDLYDADCRLGKSNYAAQANCAALLMKKIVQRLKDLGRYENSIIIFQSDHGWHLKSDPAVSPFTPFPKEIAGRLDIEFKDIAVWLLNDRSRPHAAYFRRMHALLAIKPPRAEDAPMRISMSQTQLADVAPTIYDLVGISGPSTDGKPVFSIPESVPRETHLFYRSKDYFVHFSYTAGQGWHLYPDVPNMPMNALVFDHVSSWHEH